MSLRWLTFLALVLRLSAQGLFERKSFDINNPTIITDFYSSPSSLFGWTVSLVQSGSGNSANGWIFIGDPKGNSTDPSYRSSRPNIVEPGVVWRCSLGRTGMSETCQILNIDPQPRSGSGGFCTNSACQDFPSTEFKSDAWVGGALLSNSDRFVVCSPRWMRLSEYDQYMNGLCYWFKKDQMYDTWNSDKNDLRINLKRFNHRLNPLFEENYHYRDHQQFSLPGTNWSFYDWGLGQFGMSMHLGENRGGHELLVGAPGMRLYSGAVIIYFDSGKQLQNSQTRKNKAGETQFSYYNIVPREEPQFSDHFYDYFGYSVTAGKYFGSETLYVGGSPRAKGDGVISGEVVIFRIPQRWAYQSLTPYQVINGYDYLFGAYFGSVLLTVDANRDGRDELYVAAPLCSTDTSSKTDSSESSPKMEKSIVGDQGCVFVYTSSRNKNSILLELHAQISGSGFPGGRFGSAMVSLGDINEDDYTDIAISAPFEENDHGAVYIFYGNRDAPSNWMWTDRITPKILNDVSMRGFGCSLSIGQNIDNNNTPDLAIGSFLSKNVVVLRTRPVIKLVGRVEYIQLKSEEVMNSVPHNVTRFRVKSCVTYYGSRVESVLRLQVTLLLDRNFERFQFMEKFNYESDFRVGRTVCKIFNANKLNKASNDDSRPTVAPIVTEQEIEYKGDINSENSQIQRYNIIKRSSDPVLYVEGSLNSFCSKCPFPARLVTSQLIEIASACKNPNKCIPKLKIQARFESNGKIIDSAIINWSRRFLILLSITNEGEPAYAPEMLLAWTENEFRSPLIEENSLPDGCKSEIEKEFYNCTLFDSIRTDKPMELRLPFTLNRIYGIEKPQILEFKVVVKSGGQIANTFTKLTLISEAAVKISGSIISSGIPMTEKFTQYYQITLDGQTPMETVSLSFRFPTRYLVGGYSETVLMVEKPKESVECRAENGEFTQLPEDLEPKKVVEDEKSRKTDLPVVDSTKLILSRRKRQVKESDYSKSSFQNSNTGESVNDQVNVVNTTLLNCLDKGANCMNVICTLTKVNQQINYLSHISFEMLMDPEKAIKVLGDHNDKLLVQSEGTAQILTGTKVGHIGHSKSQSIILKFQKQTEGEETPLWIYIVSGIGGLIILFLIIICLRATGFFRRKTKEDLQNLKANADVQDHMQAANNIPNFENLGDDQRLQ